MFDLGEVHPMNALNIFYIILIFNRLKETNVMEYFKEAEYHDTCISTY